MISWTAEQAWIYSRITTICSYPVIQVLPEKSHRDHRTICQFGFEISILFLACISPSKFFPASMLADLRSALHSSGERQKFITSFGFLALLLGYFPLLLLLNYGVDMPSDILVMSLQLLGVAVLFCLASSSRQKISEVLDASSVCHAVPVMTTGFVVEAFSDFLPAILTPPPNLQTRS